MLRQRRLGIQAARHAGCRSTMATRFCNWSSHGLPFVDAKIESRKEFVIS
jgi:hypothetical protein